MAKKKEIITKGHVPIMTMGEIVEAEGGMPKVDQAPAPHWLPICRFSAEDFDEEVGKYTGAHRKVELQQEKRSKVIRTVKID